MAITIRHTKSRQPRYQVRVEDGHGKWYPAKTFKRKVDAESYERKLEERRERGEDATPTAARGVTVEEYVTRTWAIECRPQKITGWTISQDRMLRLHILPVLGKMKLGQVKIPDTGRVLRNMEAIGQSEQSRLHVYNLMNVIFKAACGYHKFIASVPISTKDRPKVIVTSRRIPTPQEAIDLLLYVRDTYIGVAIWIEVLTGLRASEVQALKWRSVDFDNELIHIVEAFKRGTRKIDPFPKQKKHGVVVIPPPLKVLLQEQVVGRSPDDFVIPGIRNDMLSYSTYLKHLKQHCNELGFPSFATHDLRHACSEIWVNAGGSETDIGRVLNQSSPSVTRRYMHRTNDRLKLVAQNITLEKDISLCVVR